MTEISYEHLVERALMHVVRDALELARENGLDGNHFYITFQTNRPDVVLSKRLKASYPDEMTVVLQHEYSDLDVSGKAFSVTLSFGNIPERITVPFDAVTRFADPYAKFAVSFEAVAPAAPEPVAKAPADVPETTADGENIVSLSAFRKKK